MSRHSHHWHHQTTFAVHWTLAWDRSWAWLPGSYIKRSHPCCFCLVNIQILGAKDETLAAKANPSQFCWSWCLHVCGFFFLWAFGESDCDIYIYILYIIDLLSNQHEFTERTKPSNSPRNKTQKKAQKLAIAGKFFAGLRMLVIVGATKTFGFLCSSSKRGSSLQRS